MNRKGQTRRARIVEVANRLIYTKGYHSTSIADIAGELGITKGNLHYHFRSKEDLLEAVIAHRMEIIEGHLEDWDRAFADPRRRLKRYARILLNERTDILRHGCPMGSLNAELAKDQRPLQSEARVMFDAYLSWLTKTMGELGREDAEALARHLLVVTQGASLLGSIYGDDRFIKEEHQALEAWIDSL